MGAADAPHDLGVDVPHETAREVISTHIRPRTRPADAGSDAAALVASAARLRWRSPELALLIADQAAMAAAAAGAEAVRLRAEVLAVFACNQLGRGAEAGGRAVRALRAAQQAGEESTERLIRVELAACAADASAPSAGLTVLQPVFARGPVAAPTARAAAMVAAADCVARLGGGSEVAALLAAADQLYDTSRAVEPDAVLLRRGVVHAKLSAYHRRCGDHGTAESTALAGLALIEELAGGELDTGQVSGSLTLELVFSLLDSDRAAEAVLVAQPVLRRPVRPAGAPAACWLRLALVSRVHLPAGRHALSRRQLAEAAADAERNHLDAELAECHQLQATLHETCAEIGEALRSVRVAHTAERRWRDTAGELRTLLAAEFGHPAPAAQLRSAVAAVLAGVRPAELSPVPARSPRSSRTLRSRHAALTSLPVAPLAAAGSGVARVRVPTGPDRTEGPPLAFGINGTAGSVAAGDLAAPAEDAAAVKRRSRAEDASPGSEPEPAPAIAFPVMMGGSRPADGPAMAVEGLAVPDVGPAVPDAGPAVPDVGPAVPDAGLAVPDLGLAVPDVGSAMPDVGLAERDVGMVAPDPSADVTGPVAVMAPPPPPQPPATLNPASANGFDRGTGRHRSDVAMADLLAEALMAYQTGRQTRMADQAPAAQPEDPDDVDTPPLGLPLPVPAATTPRVRWTDLPRELVWREPGWEPHQ